MTCAAHSKRLTTTVSIGAAALAAGMPAAPADAQEAVDVTIDGGVSFSDFSEIYFEQKGGGGFDVDRDNGFYGSVAVSQKISDAWDWRVSANALSFSENTTSSGPFSVTQRLTGVTADAGVGRNFAMGGTQLRLGVGLLAARYEQSILLNLDGKFAFDTDIDYRGNGLTLSADVEHPVSADGSLKLIGGASLAPTSGEFTFSSDFADAEESIDGDALLSAAYLGLSFQQNETTELRAGLRVDRFDGDLDNDAEELGIAGGDMTTTTAFAGLRISF